MRTNLSRYIVILAALCVIWAGATWTGFADLRIVEQLDGERTETLFKGNRMASPMEDGTKTVLFCETGELTMISSSQLGRYWQGNITTFQEELDDLLGASADAFGEMGDLGALFGELFGGGSQVEETLVKVTKVGEETIAGYAAEHYIVETGNGNNWRVYEEIWIASDLLKEISAEGAACVDLMFDLTSGISSAIGFLGMDEMEAVLASPDYQALMKLGYPVRSKESVPGLFGQSMEFLSEVVEISREPISDDAFTVPSGYQRVDSVFEVFGM